MLIVVYEIGGLLDGPEFYDDIADVGRARTRFSARYGRKEDGYATMLVIDTTTQEAWSYSNEEV